MNFPYTAKEADFGSVGEDDHRVVMLSAQFSMFTVEQLFAIMHPRFSITLQRMTRDEVVRFELSATELDMLVQAWTKFKQDYETAEEEESPF